MKAHRSIPILTVGQCAYLCKEGRRHPVGGYSEEIQDVFLVTKVEGPLSYRGILFGRKECQLVCEENKHGKYHVSRVRGEPGTVHYDMMRPMTDQAAVELIRATMARLKEEAERAKKLHGKSLLAAQSFIAEMKKF